MPCNMCKLRIFSSSYACAKYYSGLCSSFKHSVVSNDSVSGQWRPWSDCADAQADLDLRCQHMHEDTFKIWNTVWDYMSRGHFAHGRRHFTLDGAQIIFKGWTFCIMYTLSSFFLSILLSVDYDHDDRFVVWHISYHKRKKGQSHHLQSPQGQVTHTWPCLTLGYYILAFNPSTVSELTALVVGPFQVVIVRGIKESLKPSV